MDLSLFQRDDYQRRWLLEVDGQTVFTQADLSENGVSLVESVNAEDDFMAGGASCAVLQFQLKDLDGSLPELAGRELSCSIGIQTDAQTDRSAARAARSQVICRRGDMLYGGFDRAPYLRVWKEQDGVWTRQTDPVQPEQPVGAILAVGDRLYCCHEKEPFLSAYTLPALAAAARPALTAFAQKKAQWYARRKLSLDRQGTRVTEYQVAMQDLQPMELTGIVFTFEPVGLFLMEKPEKKDTTLTAVTAYDRMTLFDRPVDDWLKGVEARLDNGGQILLADLLKELCAFCGVPLAPGQLFNGDYPVKRNFSAQNLTGRRVLGWIAEAAASFARITPQGQLALGWYTDKDLTLTTGDLTGMRLAEYRTNPVERLQVRSSENDIGVIVPKDAAGGNSYVIQDNPLLYAETDAELRPWARKIFDAVKNFVYRPCALTLQKSIPLLHAGDAVKLKLPDGSTQTVYIMSRTMGNGTDKFTATGKQERVVAVSGTHYQLQRLRGSTNELKRDLDSTVSTLTKYKETTDKTLSTMQTTIKQTTDEIALKASKTEVNDLGDRVEEAEASIKVNADEISNRVSKNSVISEINQTAEAIKIQASKIDLQGYVTVSDLSDPDSNTTIDGGHIKANTLSVSQLTSGIMNGGEIWITNNNGAMHLSPTTLAIGPTVDAHATAYIDYIRGSNAATLYITDVIADVVDAKSIVTMGSKNAAQKTEHYGHRLINAYETAGYYFGDIGEAVINEGKCRIDIDPIFLECVNTDYAYQVFVSAYAPGRIYVSERAKTYFIVEGDDIPFCWEIKAKRRGYETVRLKEFQPKTSRNNN